MHLIGFSFSDSMENRYRVPKLTITRMIIKNLSVRTLNGGNDSDDVLAFFPLVFINLAVMIPHIRPNMLWSVN